MLLILQMLVNVQGSGGGPGGGGGTGSGQFGDGVDVATEIVVSVQSKDIVVAGTDGLLDNMFPSEIEEILTKAQDEDDDLTPAKLAWTIAEYALYNSLDR
ncbi:hypothetical protein Q3G72_007478 [Acer saccharum]|nr:hypothetical protein Q3G72_007478 [Acer saccharum]